MKLLMIDNYDSFTFNLVQYFGELGASVEVFRNDALGVDALLERGPDGVVISPGPGEPQNAGVSVDVVRACAERGVLVEKGDPFVAPHLGGRFFRLGLSAIDQRLIAPGIAEIATAARYLRGR